MFGATKFKTLLLNSMGKQKVLLMVTISVNVNSRYHCIYQLWPFR